MRLNALSKTLDAARNKVEQKVEKAAAAIEARVVDGFEAARNAARVVHRSDDARYDGAFVTPGGKVFPVGTPLSELPAAVPAGGIREPGTILYVNGMGIEKDRQAAELQRVADKTGARVVGLHNATGGWAGDFPQAAGDKLGRGHNPAVVALRTTILDELDAGRPVHLMAHSHGALVTSRALGEVSKALEARGLSRSEVELKMADLQVETFGGAASKYPDGPRYVHYVNTADIQSAVYGMGLGGDPRRSKAGRDAVFVSFRDMHLSPVVTHDFPGTYLPARRPFDEARAGGK